MAARARGGACGPVAAESGRSSEWLRRMCVEFAPGRSSWRTRGSVPNPEYVGVSAMGAACHRHSGKGDISTLHKRGHFYFALTQRPVRFSAHGVPAKLHFGGLLRCLFEHLHRTKGGRRFPDPQNDSASVSKEPKGVVGAAPLRPTAGAFERQRRKSALDRIGEDPNRPRRNAFVAPFLGARLLLSRFFSSGEPTTTRRAAPFQGDRLRI